MTFTATSSSIASVRLANADFEQWDGLKGTPSAWIAAGSGHEMAGSTEHAVSGNTSLQLHGTDARSGTMLSQSLSPKLLHSAPTRLQGYIRTENVEGAASLFVKVSGPDGLLFQDDMRNRAISGDSSWQLASIDIPRLPDATSVSLGIILIGAGSAWFDGLAFSIRTAGATLSDVARSTIEETLTQMEQVYLDRDQVDWESLRTKTLQAAAGARTPTDTYPALRYAVSLLEDPHASFAQGSGDGVDEPHAKSISSSGSVSFTKVSPKITQLQVPAVRHKPDSEPGRTFMHDANEALEQRAAHSCGWVVDLRRNTGGNMWVMLGALFPLLRAEELGQFVSSDGESALWLRSGNRIMVQTGDSSRSRVALDSPFAVKDSDRIAILISRDTSSSGEAVAIALTGMPNTRSFGTPTGGYTTANVSLPVEGGGTVIIPTARMATRTGVSLDGPIEPDELITEGPHANQADPVQSAAIDWIEQASACSALQTEATGRETNGR